MFITKNVEVRHTKEKGKGIFATAEIAPGAAIGDYLGIVTKPDQGGDYEEGAVYDMWYSDKADICPEPNDEGVHLLNTSCEPNCAMTAIGRHTVLFALRRIFPGEELTYDYFMGDQDEECDPGTDNCCCGSDFCRGTIYSNPRAYAEWDEYLEEIMDDEPEEPPVPYGEPLPPLAEYPENFEDNNIYPMWGSHAQPPLECETEIFSNLAEIRKHMRESGRQLSFPELGIVIEGIMYGGHLAVTHMVESTHDSSCKAHKQKAEELSVSAST